MLHALGFSVSLFAFYRDKNGQPLTERGENGKPKLNEEWVDIIKLWYFHNDINDIANQ